MFIIEVELSSHDIIRHISNQLIRFKVAMNNPALKKELAQSFHEKIHKNIADIEKLINKNFGIAILIDNISEQLVEIVNVLAQDGTEVLAVPFETYIDKNSNQIHKFTTFTKEALERESKKWTFKWTTVPLEKHLGKSERKLINVFSRLNSEICLIPGVIQKSRKNWVTYQTSPLKNFCTIKFFSEFLEVHLKCNSSFKDEKGVTRKTKRTSAWTFDRVFNVRTEEDIEYAVGLIKQSFDCVCQ